MPQDALRRQTKAAWYAMQYRCDSETCREYVNYGGRGIRVCGRWRSFEAFVEDMGIKPHRDMSLDRINNDGNYEPGNCRWTSRMVQANNKRTTQWVEWEGSKIPLGTLCRQHRVSVGLVRQRLEQGWSLSDAIKVEVQPSQWDTAPIMDARLREAPVDEQPAQESLGAAVVAWIELSGYDAEAQEPYHCVVHPDGTIIYHYGDEWLRA